MENTSVTFKPPEELLESFEKFRCTSTSVCDECLVEFPEEDLKRCTQCKEVRYCGKKCQSRAWKNGHKVCCGKITVREIPNKGKGVVALRDIKMGEVVMTEKPLLIFKAGNHLTQCLSKMTDQGKRKLMQLYDRENETEGKVLGILVTNCLAGRMATSVLYYQISRLNHSCVPNVVINQQFPTSVIAIRNIPAGEEVSWCYNGDALYQDRHTRHMELQQGWAIPLCKCKYCTLSTEDQKFSDSNRLALKEVERKIKNSILEKEVKGLAELLQQKHQLLHNEGLATADNLAHIARDMLHGPLNEQYFEKYRIDGLNLANLIKDESFVKYFEEITFASRCRGCYRCKPQKY